jgi:diaminopimelate epimerase
MAQHGVTTQMTLICAILRSVVSEIRFTKLQGLGNDFLVIPVEDVSDLPQDCELARMMCQRNYGAGADGIIFVARSLTAYADFTSRIFNADGSEAGISGNGTRCVAAYLYYAGLCTEPVIRIATAAGIKRGRLIRREGVKFEFEFDMGEPRLSSRDVPIQIDPPLDRVIAYKLEAGDDTIEVTCLSMGNPQCVVFVPSLDRVRLTELGPFIENHPIFPDRTNVEFAQVLSPSEVRIRIWERGVGHTLSSGTGSCAAAVAAVLNGLTDRKVKVHNEGGDLIVNWREDNVVTLTGPAEVVYEGRWLRQ